MALQIPSYTNPFDPNHPLENAYAWLAGLFLDLSANTGRIVLNINPNEAAWQSPPIGQLSMSLNEVIVPANEMTDPPTPQRKFPSLEELMSDPDFLNAWNVIGAKLYEAAMLHPKLEGSTQV